MNQLVGNASRARFGNWTVREIGERNHRDGHTGEINEEFGWAFVVECIPRAKDGNVAAGAEINKHRIVLAFSLVVFLELASEATSFCSDNRVLAWMIGRLAIIYLRADCVFLKCVLVSADGLIDRKAEKPRQPVGLSEDRTLQYACELFENTLI